jgi:transcriptional regulator with XRE-family HTH domain
MPAIQKNAARKKGRPRLSASVKLSHASRLKADGVRLRSALETLGLSQSDAARVTGLRQSWINGIVNGRRALGREDLRKLGHAGISPAFLLGLTTEHVPPGASRTRGELPCDVADFAVAELKKTLASVDGHWEVEVDGEMALSYLIASLAPEVKRAIAFWRAEPKVIHQLDTLARSARKLAVDPDVASSLNAIFDQLSDEYVDFAWKALGNGAVLLKPAREGASS